MTKLTRTNFSVKELTDMYANGEIAIPEIQRDFVWDAKRIRLLLDSIHKDYPSGAIILWRPEFKTRSEFEMLIRPERLHLYQKRLPTYLLLDGQQRLTALCAVILPSNQVISSLGEEIDLPKLFINLKTLEIEARKDSLPYSNNEVLLNRLLSIETEESGLSTITSELAARKDITAKHRNGYKDFRERILQYTYPVQILEGHDYETVSDIFKRVNSQGKILVTAELELATIIPHWNDFSKHLRTFIKAMRSEGFNADLPFYMRCLAYIATDWPAIDYFSKQVVKDAYSRAQLERYWGLTKRSIRKLHALLKRHNIDRTELVTTRNALVPIVYAIAKDKKSRISDGLFIKWLIYAMDGGHYTQQTEAVLRRDSYVLAASLPKIEDGFAKLYRQMIKKDLSWTTFGETDFEGVPAKNPAMLFMYLAMRHCGAVDFGGKNALPLDQILKYQIHHVFPIEFMLADEAAEKYRKQQGLSRAEFKDHINDVANLTFVSVRINQEIKKRPPYDYLPKMTSPDNRLAHCIPEDPELWKPENFDKFCDERRHLIAKAMNAYLKGLE
jgi:hypothetical protein